MVSCRSKANLTLIYLCLEFCINVKRSQPEILPYSKRDDRTFPTGTSDRSDMNAIATFVPDTLWFVEYPLNTYGLEVGTRMTICHLSSGALWVHSPIKPDQSLCQQIDSLYQFPKVVSYSS